MALHAAEEESIEALKRWWNENGKQLVILVVVVFAGYTAWLLWQNSRTASINEASDTYEEILSLVAPVAGEEVGEDARQRAVELASNLRDNHPGSVYARYAALFAAQSSVILGDLPAAEAWLQWVIENPLGGLLQEPDDGLQLTASLRLGRVILAQGEPERALELVNSVDPQTFEAGFAELRGDIYAAMERWVDARDAYLAAQQAGSASDGLRLKLQDLADQG